MNEVDELQQQRRQERKRRRIRNQILAYMTVILVVFIFAVGVVFGIQYLTSSAQKREQQIEEQKAKVEELLDEEEDIELPEEPEEEIVELTTEQKLDEIVNAGIEVMPVEDKVAGLFVVTPEAITGVSAAVMAGDGTKDALGKYAVGGIIYSKINMTDSEQFTKMVNNTKLFSKYPLFLASREEGGSISSLTASNLGEAVDSAKAIGETGDENNAYASGIKIGSTMALYGLNLDLGPVADLALTEDSIVAKRAYGSQANEVAPYVSAVVNALESQKITGCVMHFPGIGSVSQDTEQGMVVTERSFEDFSAQDIEVFKQVIAGGAKMIMASNISAPSITGDNTPCSLSSIVVTDQLRGELGFDGVVISAPLNEKAISEYYAADEAAVMALKAGCDMILMPEDFEKAYEGVLKAVKDGTISEKRVDDALRRIYRIKYADKIEE